MNNRHSGMTFVFAALLIAAIFWPVTTVAAVPAFDLDARLIAAGIPGVGGVRQIGMFHAGGAITGNPEFLVQTRPGHVLDPERVMVTSLSNFGAPVADRALATGAVLSLDTRGSVPMVIPPQFAVTGRQATAANGAVRLFTAQSPAFLNHYYNRRAHTAKLPAVAGPRYISINNAFGRPWFANAPLGATGLGMNSVIDPDGRPLDNAPSASAGGVFAAADTNRTSQFTAGDLFRGALGTAFLGASPDATGFAVFAVVKADGSLSQVHVQDGVDGLAPPDTVTPVNPDSSEDAGLIGVAFKWNPQRMLYVADRARNRIAALLLNDDTRHFTLQHVTYLTAPELHQPVDLAAAIPEVANPRFASHTTLAGGSDLYVANRGDGMLLRVDQSGRVLARARVVVPGLGVIGANQLRGLAVSSDAQRIWLTLPGPVPGYSEGVLVEVNAFDAAGPYRAQPQPTITALDPDVVNRGAILFAKEFTPAEGLGPLFNARACVTCHSQPGTGGMSDREEHFAVRVAQVDPVSGRALPLHDMNSPVARRHSNRELGQASAPLARIPREANITSMRMPPALYELGLIEQIPDEAILAQAYNKGDGVHGRPNRVTTARGEQRIGRYGWKANVASLDEMVANAFVNELGIPSPLALALAAPGVPASENTGHEANRGLIDAVTAYLRALRLPPPKTPP